MRESTLTSYESPARHQAVSELISRHSVNPADVRHVALSGWDLSSVHNVLDLGCGFGFMIDALASRVAQNACLVGVDACPDNEAPFLERVALTGMRGAFRCHTLHSELHWPDESFDLVLANYALYFFPGILPEISRVLTPHGLFLTITHSEASCRSQLRAIDLEDSASPLLSLACRFSAENGARVLAPYFEEIERIDYENNLAFEAGDFEDLLTYLSFKLPSLEDPDQVGDESLVALEPAARQLLSRRMPLIVEKNDAVFRCREPRCP